jgi:hypothetical protein
MEFLVERISLLLQMSRPEAPALLNRGTLEATGQSRAGYPANNRRFTTLLHAQNSRPNTQKG